MGEWALRHGVIVIIQSMKGISHGLMGITPWGDRDHPEHEGDQPWPDGHYAMG
jgi:hypothetical protein